MARKSNSGAADLRAAGNGALYAGDPIGEPHEMATGKEVGKIETTPFEN
jgi:hypothetical protein